MLFEVNQDYSTKLLLTPCFQKDEFLNSEISTEEPWGLTDDQLLRKPRKWSKNFWPPETCWRDIFNLFSYSHCTCKKRVFFSFFKNFFRGLINLSQTPSEQIKGNSGKEELANRAKEEDTSRATHLSLADNVDHAKKKKFRSSMNSSFNAIYCGLIASNKDKTY